MQVMERCELPITAVFFISLFLSSTEEKKLSISAVSALVSDIIDQHVTREEVLQRMKFIPEPLRDKPFHPMSWRRRKNAATRSTMTGRG